MGSRYANYLAIAVLIFISVAAILGLARIDGNSVDAYPAPSDTLAAFMGSPYYESRTIISYMDHKYPTYSHAPNNTSPEMVRYDGETWSQAPVTTCTAGLNCYDGHDGYDFASWPEGHFRVLAAAGGDIVFADWDDPDDHSAKLGLSIQIDHPNDYKTIYGHLSSIVLGVDPGVPQEVGAKELLATSGNTGNSSGPHLHLATFHNITEVDPYGWSPANPVATPDPWEQYSGVGSEFLWVAGDQVGDPFQFPQYGVGDLILVYDPGFQAGCPESPFECPLWFYDDNGTVPILYTCVNGDVGDYWAEWYPTLSNRDFTRLPFSYPITLS